ncbi:MAG: signal peptidase II [Pseudomonadota bacterium]
MRLLAIIAVLVFVVDQATKYAVVFGLDLINLGVIDVSPPFLRFVMAWNRGVNFGVLAAGSDIARWALVALSLAIAIGLVWWAHQRRRDRWFLIGAGLVVGGALGNIVDRALFGAVMDFLNMSCCGLTNPYVFNVADIAIFAGAGVLIATSGETKKAKTEKGEP